jgi:multiple sugar transport system permease protein
MQITAWESYSPTLLRWLLVGGGLMISILLLYRVLRYFGVNREAATGYALILPWLLGFLILNLYPFASSLYLSFTEYNIFQPPQWVGLDNYVKLFTGDRHFYPNLKFTFFYAVINVPLGMAGALGVALLLNRALRGIGVWRTVYYLPEVLPAAAVALLWGWILAPRSGMVNFFLRPVYDLLNMEPLQWFTDVDLVLPSYVIMGMWGFFGANAIILLAGLKNIPQELYEVADLDGANGWQKFWIVTIPMLSSALLYALVTGVIGALQIFDQAFFITTPTRAPQFLNVVIYREAFTFRHMGYASAMAWVLMIIVLIATLLVFRSTSAFVYYEGEGT